MTKASDQDVRVPNRVQTETTKPMTENIAPKNSLIPVMLSIMAVLAIPYLLIKTGVWKLPGRFAQSDLQGDWFGNPNGLPVIHPIGDFSMTNQHGRAVERSDLLGQVWVAAVIFTRCPGPCAMMTTRMADLQESVPKEWPVRFVSITADTDHDVPDVLRAYAENFQADAKRWHFLHGTKPEVVDLVVNNLKLVVLDKEQERESPNDLFIHSTVFALVDRQGRLRGAFESVPVVAFEDDDPLDPNEVWKQNLKPRMLQSMEYLINEPE